MICETNSINLVSKHRQKIMGIAIILIILFHSAFTIPIISSFFDTLYCGVDIFLFVSGFGIYVAIKKYNNTLLFYKKRISKIFPIYIPAVFCYYIIFFVKNGYFSNGFYLSRVLNNFSIIISNIFCFSFWLRMPTFVWYVPVIVLLYTLSPILEKSLSSVKHIALTVLIATIINIPFFYNDCLIGASRFFIYYIGMLFGKIYYENKKINIKIEIFLYVLSVVGVLIASFCAIKLEKYLTVYGLYWYPYILIIPGLVFALARLFNFIENVKILKFINLFFSFLGCITLEIYLIHVIIFDFVPFPHSNMWQLLRIIISVCVSVIYYYLIKFFVKNIYKKHRLING